MNYLYQSPYPSHQELETFSEEFAVPLVQIQNWFKYQRRKNFFHHGQTNLTTSKVLIDFF